MSMDYDLYRIGRWIEDGCDPRARKAPTAFHLDCAEGDGLIDLTEIRGMGEQPRLIVTLTGKGWYEYKRLGG